MSKTSSNFVVDKGKITRIQKSGKQVKQVPEKVFYSSIFLRIFCKKNIYKKITRLHQIFVIL